MKTILTATGEKVVVDNDDYLILSKRNWYLKTNKYSKLICTAKPLKNKKQKMVLMHREILGLSDPDKIVIHRNGNPFDNRKSNLFVIARGKQNSLRKRNYNTKSYKGVHYKKENRNYVAAISKDGIKYHLGSFETAEEAAKMYDKAALILHGKRLAKTNKSLGLIHYNSLPLTPIEFNVLSKGRYMSGVEDKRKIKTLRKILKQMCHFYSFTEVADLLEANVTTIRRFVSGKINLRSGSFELFASRLKKLRKGIEKSGLKIDIFSL